MEIFHQAFYWSMIIHDILYKWTYLKIYLIIIAIYTIINMAIPSSNYNGIRRRI